MDGIMIQVLPNMNKMSTRLRYDWWTLTAKRRFLIPDHLTFQREASLWLRETDSPAAGTGRPMNTHVIRQGKDWCLDYFSKIVKAADVKLYLSFLLRLGTAPLSI